MNPALIGLAKKLGAKVIHDVLVKKIGKDKADLADAVIREIADHAGLGPEQVEAAAEKDPVSLEEAIRTVEPMAAELVALYAQGLEGQFALLQAEQKEPWFAWAWRPMWMYLLGWLWLWHFFGLGVVNAVFRASIVAGDPVVLMQLTGLFLALYMGGHTIKDFVARRFGAGEPK